MAFRAGQIEAILGGRFNPAGFAQFDTAMKRSGRNMTIFDRDLDRSGRRSSATMRAIGTAARTGAAVGIIGLGAALVGAVKKAADFESQLSSLQSITRANSREMGLFKKQALAAGAATKFSALEAAQAQTELAKGGLTVQQIMKGGLKAALGLAAAGEIDLGLAAQTTANAMNLFGLEGDHAVHVADALATAANATTADVGDFALAMTQGGSAAKAAGLSFDEAVAFLESLANAGIKGSDAGTSMKTALVQLASPTAKASALMDELGIHLFDAHGNMKPLADIAGIFQDKLGGLTRQQRLQAATTLVGNDGMRALLSLYDAGPDAIASWERGLAKQGTAADVAAKKQDNLKGKIENLKGSIETAAIILGTALIPTLQKGAENLTDFINRAAASGDLQRFGHDVAGVLQDAARIGIDVGAGLIDVGHAAGTALGPIGALINLFGGLEHVIPMLAGAAAGLLAFRAAATVAPMVAALATALGDVILAFRAGGLAFAASTLVSMLNPVSALAVAFVGLGGAIGYLLSRESSEEAQARRTAAAKRDQATAVRDLTSAEQEAADAGLALARARLEHERAEQDFDKVRQHAKRGSLEYRDAQLREREAANQLLAARRRYSDELGKQAGQETKLRSAGEKRIALAREELDAAQRQRRSLSEQRSGKEALERADRRVERAERAYADATDAFGSAARRASVSEVNRIRAMQGLEPVARRNQRAVQALMAGLNGLPKSVRTRLLTEDQDALRTLGNLTAKLIGFGRIKTVRKILAETGSAEQAIAALRRDLAAIPDEHVNIITHRLTVGGGTTGTGPGARTRAAGRGPGVREAALVGEGRGPEWAVDPVSGHAVRVAGPMLMDLGPTDYVVPTEPRFRGRALELLAAIAKDLGVQAFKKGKHGGHRFVPKPRQFYRLSADDLEQARDNARNRWQDVKSRSESAKGADKKRLQDQAAKLKTEFEHKRAIAARARVYADKIAKQEDLVEIARQQMDLADKQDNQRGYNKALKRRRNALGALEALLMTAVRFSPDGSKFQREVRKQLLQTRNDAQDLIGAEGDFGADRPEATLLTPEEQARLDRLEADVALAGLTTPTDDDRAALEQLVAFREAVLGRVLPGGNLGFIRQAAEDVKSARDELASLTSAGPGADVQAQLDQANARTAAALEDARLSRAFVTAMTPGAIGANNQGPIIEQHFHAPIPATSEQRAQIAGAAVAGIDLQGARISPRQRVEV